MEKNNQQLSKDLEKIKHKMETLRELHHNCRKDELNDEVISHSCLYRNRTANAIEDEGIEIEFCLTCDFPVAPEYEVEENTCPYCNLAFDLPDRLKENPKIEDKETLQEKFDYYSHKELNIFSKEV